MWQSFLITLKVKGIPKGRAPILISSFLSGVGYLKVSRGRKRIKRILSSQQMTSFLFVIKFTAFHYEVNMCHHNQKLGEYVECKRKEKNQLPIFCILVNILSPF